MKIVLASSNPGKVKEFQALLKDLDFQVLPQSDFGIEDAEETGLSFVENAIIKARHAAQLTGLPALADDSGLCVKALQGAPGIYSSRYAGNNAQSPDNIKKLLLALENTDTDKRQANFHCTLAFMLHALDPTPVICHGDWHGVLLQQAKGDHGFGYDPIFYLAEENKTAAELPAEIKNKISHRAKAMQSLLKILAEKI